MKRFKNLLQFSFITSCILFLSIQSTFAQGNAFLLDGTDDYIDCGSSPSLNINGNAITLEAWIYPTSFQPNFWQGNIINRDFGNATAGYMIRAGATGQVNFNIGNGTWNELTSPINTISLNTWHHIAATYDGSNMRLYVDGLLIGALPLTGNIGGTAGFPLYLGDDPSFTGRYFPGRIDEVRIWDVARTQQEIMQDMNNTSCAPFSPNLLAYYQFNQGIANGNNTGLTTVTDAIASNNGTLNNATLNGTNSNWVEGVALSVSDSTLTICQGDSALLAGAYQTTSGVYFDSLPAANGCDSFIRTTLTVIPSVMSTANATICQGDSILLGGSYQTATGIYVDTFQAANGCDSLLSTTLIVLVPASITVSNQICQGDSILLGGTYQTTAGTYMDSISNMMGCDSVIITTNLSIIPTITTSDTLGICQGDSILLGGAYQTTTGIYLDTFSSSTGCDSIHQQVLEVYPLPVVTLSPFTPDTLCDNGAPIPLPMGTPAGGTYTGNGVSGTNFDPAISGTGVHYVVYSYTDVLNCSAVDSTVIMVNICLGLEDISSNVEVNIFPNPVQNTLTIQHNISLNSPLNINIVDALGRTLKNSSFTLNDKTTNIDVSDLDHGIYFVVLSNEEHSIVRKISK